MSQIDRIRSIRLEQECSKQKITPLVGDYVEFESGNQDEGVIQKLLERKNELTRPQVANVDIGIIIMSAAVSQIF